MRPGEAIRATELDFCLTTPKEGRWCGDAGEIMTFFFGDRPCHDDLLSARLQACNVAPRSPRA